jgi:transposase
VHANAPLTPTGRRIMCERIAMGRPIAHVAEAMGVSRQTASKWWNRYLVAGEAALVDRRSRPHVSPRRLDRRTERRFIGLRVNRRWGPARIAGHLGLVTSTVWRVLARFGISRLRNLDPSSGRTIRGLVNSFV